MDEYLYNLTDIIDKDLKSNSLSKEEKSALCEQIKPLLSQGAIALAQINPHSGDIKGNALKAVKRGGRPCGESFNDSKDM